jgi:hypothetical protein
MQTVMFFGAAFVQVIDFNDSLKLAPEQPSPTPMFISVRPIASHPIPRLNASAEGRDA